MRNQQKMNLKDMDREQLNALFRDEVEPTKNLH